MPSGGIVTSAQWAADGRAVLLALSSSSVLVALYLVGTPPALVDQMLPLPLPGVSQYDRITHDSGALGRASGSSAAPCSCIADIAWNQGRQRLAVSLQAPHPGAGLVALYATSCEPLISASLLGFARARGAGEPGSGR